MYDDAAVTLRDLLKDEKRVLFTGHSGGGAVAAYVYKELYSEAVKDQGPSVPYGRALSPPLPNFAARALSHVGSELEDGLRGFRVRGSIKRTSHLPCSWYARRKRDTNTRRTEQGYRYREQ